MKKKAINAESIFSFLLIVLGAYVIVVSCGYGIWDDIKPAKGFMPFISSVLMTACSVLWFLQSIRPAKAGETDENSGTASFSKVELKWLFAVPAMCLATVFLMRWLGMIAALALFMLLWFKFISKLTWLKTLLYTVILTAVYYGVFVVALEVPFPKFFGLF